jgi:hypothetical protein
MDNSHPVPCYAVVAIATGFELHLKGALEKFAQENAKSFQLRTEPLGKMATAIRKGDPFMIQALTHYRLDPNAILAAINKLLNTRNRAVHEGNISLAVVVQYRDDLLDPINGIFGSLFPS